MTDAPLLRPRTRLFAIAAILGLLWLRLYTLSPASIEVPRPDPGIFLYVGQQLTDGALLYRDVFDHKPPLVFWVNALGLRLAPSWWGVWALEGVLLSAAVVLSVRLLRRVSSDEGALLAAFGWVLALVSLLVVNQIQEFALVFQFAALAAIHAASSAVHLRAAFGWGIAVGVWSALLLGFQQNLIGVGAAAGVVWAVDALRGDRAARARLGGLLVGGAGLLALLVGYFVVRGTFPDMIDAVLTYNVAYGQVAWGDRLDAALTGITLTNPSGMFLLALLVWAAALAAVVTGQRRRRERSPLLMVALVGLPLEMALASLSGKVYPHYYVAWLPTLAVLLAHLGDVFVAAPGTAGQRRTLALVACVMLVLTSVDFAHNARLYTSGQSNVIYFRSAIRVIEDFTQPDDTVLIWGNTPSIYFLTNRRASSRFAVVAHLHQPGYTSQRIAAEYVAALEQRPPVMIIDTSGGDPRLPPFDQAGQTAYLSGAAENSEREYVTQTLAPELSPVYTYLQEHYVLVNSIGDVWGVWQRRPAQ